MTTKQEIIEHLLFCNMDIYERGQLITMIEEFKPKINVKKLVWFICEDLIYRAYCYKDKYYNISYKVEVFHDKFVSVMFNGNAQVHNTFEEAKAKCEQHWNEYVQSLVEVE